MENFKTTVKAEGQSWEPKYYTEHLDLTEGSVAIDLIEKTIIAFEGFKAGEPVKLAEWQKWTIEQTLALNADGTFKFSKFLLMVPRKNGKTFLGAVLVVYHLLTAPKYAQLYSAGKNRETASIIFEMVKNFLNESAVLRKYLRYEKSKNRIINIRTSATFRPLSSDGDSLNGKAPYFVIADEMHVWEGAGTSSRAKDFWTALSTGSGALKNSQIIILTTVGANEHGTLLGELYSKGVRVAEGREKDPYFGFVFWGANEEDDPFDIKTWRKTNPNLAEGLIKEKAIESELLSATATGIQGFLRMHLNIWARVEGDPFINKFYWEKAIRSDYRIPEGAKIVVGFDGSKSGDTTVVMIQEIESGHVEVWEFWEKDELDEEWFVSRDQVFESLKKLDIKFQVELAWVDASYWHQEIPAWNDYFSWHSQKINPTTPTMVPLAVNFLKDLTEQKLTHPDDENLNAYSLRAIKREDGGFGKASAKASDRIDLLVGAILANGARSWVQNLDEEEEQEFFILS